jgi:hypothetical protein
MFFMLLLLFVAEYFVYQFATQKYGHQYRQTVILSGVLNVCGALSPTLGGGGGEKHKTRVFDSRVLWKIFDLKRDEVRGE